MSLVGFFKTLAASLFLLPSVTQAADFFFETNGFYISDGSKFSSTATETKMLLDFALGFGIDKRSQWQVGWNYSMHSTSTSGDDTVSYSSTEMGPKINYYLDRNRSWGISFAYNLIVNGSYEASGTTHEWRGTSMRADFGYGGQISEQLRLGLRLVYNIASFNEEVDDTTLTNISYTRTLMYPAIHLSYLF